MNNLSTEDWYTLADMAFPEQQGRLWHTTEGVEEDVTRLNERLIVAMEMAKPGIKLDGRHMYAIAALQLLESQGVDCDNITVYEAVDLLSGCSRQQCYTFRYDDIKLEWDNAQTVKKHLKESIGVECDNIRTLELTLEQYRKYLDYVVGTKKNINKACRSKAKELRSKL